MRDRLTDGRIAVRAYRPGDERGLSEAIRESIPELARYYLVFPTDFGVQHAKEWVDACIANRDEGRSYHHVIESVPGGTFLGECGIELDLPNKNAEIGYWVRSNHTRQGVATAAARLVAQLAFEDLGLIRLEISTRSDNVASRRVAEKVGAVLEGVLRSKTMTPSGPVDCLMYGLLPHELRLG
jgi:RimJ/RimL family protein N-acetyltransferase